MRELQYENKLKEMYKNLEHWAEILRNPDASNFGKVPEWMLLESHRIKMLIGVDR